jgi:predicted ribosome quality control (RQC) complex YloA/Tae2 family protein
MALIIMLHPHILQAMKVEIDLRKSIPENAKTYYEKVKKAKRKIPGLKKALKKTQEELEKLDLEEVVVEEPEKIKRRKKKWFEKYRWFKSSDGFLVIGGRDATTNDILIKKHLEDNDLVFHANIQGAPFFVVKNPERKEIPESTLREAAEAAASYSSAWKEGLGSCDVYYVNPDQVSKTPPAGEYLPKGAFMIYGKKRWYKNTPLKVAIGYQDEEPHIIGGPISAVEESSSVYVILEPGRDKVGLVAEKIKSFFTGKKILDTPMDGIQYWIPSGKGNVIL